MPEVQAVGSSQLPELTFQLVWAKAASAARVAIKPSANGTTANRVFWPEIAALTK